MAASTKHLHRQNPVNANLASLLVLFSIGSLNKIHKILNRNKIINLSHVINLVVIIVWSGTYDSFCCSLNCENLLVQRELD